MNAGQESQASMMADIYRVIMEIRYADYIGWCAMDNAQLCNEVMQRTGGHYNPAIVNNIIQRL